MAAEVPAEVQPHPRLSPMPASQPRRNDLQHSLSFIPKPFPPPALQDVPEAYIVSQLHRLALSYWDRPETADCTIIVPCELGQRPRADTAPQPPQPDPLMTGPFGEQHHGVRRRDSEPPVNTRRMVLKLHQDYLSAQSMFMRALLSGSSPLDLSKPVARTASPPTPNAPAPSRSPPRQPTSHLAAGAFPIHPSRHPRVLPSSSSHHPVIFLPVPDAISFPHLVHYIYFGTFDYMEECLHRGIITWQGVVRNVEYLGMRLELKASLGKYYRQWLRPNTPTQDSETPVSSVIEDSEEEDAASDMSLGSAAGENQDQNPDYERSP